MPIPLRPQLRPLEMIPVGSKEEALVVLRDPEELGAPVVLPCGAAVLAMLMDGDRTLLEIQSAFRAQTGVSAALSDLEAIVRRLDEACLLAGDRFDEHRQQRIEEYVASPIRSASHAGGAYEDDPEKLRKQLAELFTGEGGPGPVDWGVAADGRDVCGIIAPHVDIHRGGPTFAWAYKHLVEHSSADLFVIFGTAHHPMDELFCVSRKDFSTPLGIARTDQGFIDRLAEHLASSVAGGQLELFADEPAHRLEHSIEFQVLLLQYLLQEKREFRIVPVLVGSFHGFLDSGSSPGASPEVQAFVAAVRAAAERHEGAVCYISGADFAHIGQHFGDQSLLDERRLARQEQDDRELLAAVCRCDSAALFAHVAKQHDRYRVCGLSPTYTMLEVMGPVRGELLKYDQAVEPDGTACVSFASAAFYRT